MPKYTHPKIAIIRNCNYGFSHQIDILAVCIIFYSYVLLYNARAYGQSQANMSRDANDA